MALYPSYTPIQVFGMAGVAACQYALVGPQGYPMGPTGAIANGASRGMGLPTMVKSAASNFPAPRTVYVTGSNGRKKLAFVFDAATIGEFDMSFGAFDMNFYTATSATKIQTIGDWQMVGRETNQDPATVQVSLLFNIDLEAADNVQLGLHGWLNVFIPLCNVFDTGSKHNEAAAADTVYRVIPVQSANVPWGVPATSANNGFTAAAQYNLTSKNPLTMDTYISDGSNAAVTLNYRPAEDVTGNGAFVFRNGSPTPIGISGLVIATKLLTMASNGAQADVNVIPYEVIAADLLAA